MHHMSFETIRTQRFVQSRVLCPCSCNLMRNTDVIQRDCSSSPLRYTIPQLPILPGPDLSLKFTTQAPITGISNHHRDHRHPSLAKLTEHQHRYDKKTFSIRTLVNARTSQT